MASLPRHYLSPQLAHNLQERSDAVCVRSVPSLQLTQQTLPVLRFGMPPPLKTCACEHQREEEKREKERDSLS